MSVAPGREVTRISGAPRLRLPLIPALAVLTLSACFTQIRTGSGQPGGDIRRECYVEIYNATDVSLDVSYTVRTGQGMARRRLGMIRPEQSRTVTAACGSWVEATGTGNGRHAQGGGVAGQLGDSSIVLR